MNTIVRYPPFPSIDKPKALSLLLHTADISHPAKNWDLHHHWTTSLLEEFFRQVRRSTGWVKEQLAGLRRIQKGAKRAFHQSLPVSKHS